MTSTVYAFAFRRPDDKWGVINDSERRVIVSRYEAVADHFATVLETRSGLSIVPVPRTAMQIAELVMQVHVSATDIGQHVVFIENGQTDLVDVLFKAAEMAEAVPMDTPGDWWAANTPRTTAA